MSAVFHTEFAILICDMNPVIPSVVRKYQRYVLQTKATHVQATITVPLQANVVMLATAQSFG